MSKLNSVLGSVSPLHIWCSNVKLRLDLSPLTVSSNRPSVEQIYLVSVWIVVILKCKSAWAITWTLVCCGIVLSHYLLHKNKILFDHDTDSYKYLLLSFWKTSFKGGVIGIKIGWICDLDKLDDQCKPSYSFTRLDAMSQVTTVSPGYNFRYVQTFHTEKSITKLNN